MNSLQSPRVAEVLKRLFRESEASAAPMMEQLACSGLSLEDAIKKMVAQAIRSEKTDFGASLEAGAEMYFAISPEFGGFLYGCARACKARRIVEFGTSMGVSAIHLAAALRDNGGGLLIGSEFLRAKVAKARSNLAAAGLSDLVDIREGDARQTLRDIEGPIDLVLLDGAFTLYHEVISLLAPKFAPGTLIIAENAFEEADGYLAYVRDPANGYCSQSIPINVGRGNEFTVVTGAPDR